MCAAPEAVLADAPDPQMARVALERVREAGGAVDDPDRAPAAARLLGFSTVAADFFVRHPEETALLGDTGPRGRQTLDAELAHEVAGRGPAEGLRRFRRRAMLRIAARDLGGASLEDVVAEISAVADVCLEVACREAAGGRRLAVVALGKLGGAELNYSSDVDVLFLHDANEDPRAAEAAAGRLIALLSEPTDEGIALRVDPTLRPGGRSGPLSLSVESALDHYERRAATWERQAMIKARAAAGDPWLGSAFVDGVLPFVYPAQLAPQAIDEVRRTKVRLEEYIRQRGKELTEVKRGRGGIRDVEFAVQLLQIVHGRRDPRLRDPNTLRALATLAEEGYVARGRRRRPRRRLPVPAPAGAPPADGAGPADPRPAGGPARPPHDRPLAGAGGRRGRCSSSTTAPPRRSAASTSGCSTGRCWRRSRAPPRSRPGSIARRPRSSWPAWGSRSPARSYEVLRRLVDPATRMGKVLAHAFAVMAPALALAVDPDAALVRLERVAEAVGTQDRLADALANDPGAARRLAHAVAVSSFATDLLVAVPARLLALPDAGDAIDPQAALVATVARSAGRELSLRETGVALSDVADRVVRDAMAAEDPGLPFAVIGLGKLGAGELNVASDLDLVFVYEGEGPADLKRAGSVAEHVMQGIRAQGWEPDADLRPEGRGGPLARSIAGFLEYWQRYAELWEFQSLLRARVRGGRPGPGSPVRTERRRRRVPTRGAHDRPGRRRSGRCAGGSSASA